MNEVPDVLLRPIGIVQFYFWGRCRSPVWVFCSQCSVGIHVRTAIPLVDCLHERGLVEIVEHSEAMLASRASVVVRDDGFDPERGGPGAWGPRRPARRFQVRLEYFDQEAYARLLAHPQIRAEYRPFTGVQQEQGSESPAAASIALPLHKRKGAGAWPVFNLLHAKTPG